MTLGVLKQWIGAQGVHVVAAAKALHEERWLIGTGRAFSLDLNQFCSKPVGKQASLWSTQDCISLSNLQTEASKGACLRIIWIWFNRQIRPERQWQLPFPCEPLQGDRCCKDSQGTQSKSPWNESFSICFNGPKPIYHVHWKATEGRRLPLCPGPEQVCTGQQHWWRWQGGR